MEDATKEPQAEQTAPEAPDAPEEQADQAAGDVPGESSTTTPETGVDQPGGAVDQPDDQPASEADAEAHPEPDES